MNKLIFTIVMMVLFSTFVFSQDNTDFGLWNDVQVSHGINKNVDLFVGAKIESKTNSTKMQEQRYYGGLLYKYKDWTFNSSVVVVELAATYWETRPVFTVGRKFNLSKDKTWTLTPRFRTEFRIRPGANKFRFVPILTLEKKFNAKYKGFITAEYYRDMRETDVTNHWKRFYFGVNRTINKKVSVDMFYLFQKAENGVIKYNHKLGLTWKIRL